MVVETHPFRALVATWRDEAAVTPTLAGAHLRRCADELEALLPPTWPDGDDRWRQIPYAEKKP